MALRSIGVSIAPGQIVKEYLDRYFETFPTLATAAGRHEFDDRLEETEQAYLEVVARGERELGEAVAEVAQREVAALGDGAGSVDPRRLVGKARRHLCGRLQIALAVAEQEPARCVERGLPAQAGERQRGDAEEDDKKRNRRRRGGGGYGDITGTIVLAPAIEVA